jgi:pimeloyl-ACP methyl ester carboxylesterase
VKHGSGVPVFDANGIPLYYEEKGSGEPIVFVHGTLCDYRCWSSQVDALSNQFRTIAYSRRYAHPNERKGDAMDSTVQNNAEDLAALIGGLVGGKVHLVGHSYGGFISAYFATVHPEMLRSLTLVNAAVGTMLVETASPSAALGLLFRSPSVALSARRLLNGTKDAVKAIEMGDARAVSTIFLPALQNNRKDLPPKPMEFEKFVEDNARTLKETTTEFPHVTKTEMGGLKIPSLVLWGELSAPWDSRISKMLADSIPGSEAAEIAGAGHFCMIEKAAEVNGKMAAFFGRHSSAVP